MTNNPSDRERNLQITEAYNEGYEVGKANVGKDNPYAMGHTLRRYWLDGYSDAQLRYWKSAANQRYS